MVFMCLINFYDVRKCFATPLEVTALVFGTVLMICNIAVSVM